MPKTIKEKGKVDILLWWGDGTPRAVIEIKNQIYGKDQYDKDIKRIGDLLVKGDQSLQFGIFAFYDSADTGRIPSCDIVVNRVKKIYQNVCKIVGKDVEVSLKKIITEIDESAWVAACLLIKPTK